MSDAPDSLQSTQVHLDGLFDVLAKHLYSTPVVAVRELIQNAHDSIGRRRLEERPGFTAAGRIEVQSDEAERLLIVRDNGSGLTEQELHQYLATVGRGYTRELRQDGAADAEGLIGYFGLGFLSAFVVAEQVVVETCSYQTPGAAWRYQSKDGRRYAVQAIAERAVGTEVRLTLRPDFAHLASTPLLQRVLLRYCALLPEPLWIGDEQVNAEAPPWRSPDGVTPHPAALQRQRMAFASRMARQFEPICTFPIEPDGHSDVRGLLWVQDGGSYASSDNRQLSVYVRGMLLDDDARDLLPVWAGFIGGVIESGRLTPTASREDLQRDEAWQAARAQIQRALIQGLSQLARSQGPAWERLLTRHNEALLGASLCEDALFDMLADSVRIPTNQGDLPARALVHDKRLHLGLGRSGGFEDMLFRALHVPVARGDRYAVAGFLRQWAASRQVLLVEIGTALGNARLFRPAELAADAAAWLRQHLGWGEELVPARFDPAELPLVVVPDREAQLKARLEADEAGQRMASAALSLARAFTERIDASVSARLYLNLDSPAVQALLARRGDGQPPATALALLRSFKALMAPAGETVQGQPPLQDSLKDFSAAVVALCTPGEST